MIPSSLFNLQRWGPNDDSSGPPVGQKRCGSFLLNLPDFDLETTDEGPTETIRKALSVLSKAQAPVLPNNLDPKNNRGMIQKPPSDALSVSTASTTSLKDEESDIEVDQEDEVPITSLPPDALFIVQGKEFPCHTRMLSKEARPLLDIMSRDGALERKTKRRRTSSSSRDQAKRDDCEPQPWSSPSGITVARLSNDVNADFFEVLMEYLYTKEIRLKLPEGFDEDDQEDDPWLMGSEDLVDNFEDEEDEYDDHLPDIHPPEEEPIVTTTPLKFLQGSFSLADRFGCTSLKSELERKIYDEFLFSFTAKELVAWAEQNDCAFLRQKAIDKVPKPPSNV